MSRMQKLKGLVAASLGVKTLYDNPYLYFLTICLLKNYVVYVLLVCILMNY